MIIERSPRNPILAPNLNQSWEAEAVFNGCPAVKGSRIYLLYRALSVPHYHTTSQTRIAISDIGIAESTDGVRFSNRRRLIIPEEPWERFGCEDPRVTKLGGAYYIFYTALSAYPFRADGIKVGVAVSNDLLTIREKHLVTPFNAKGMALFPEKIGGKIWAVLTVHTDCPPAHICLASFSSIEEMWSERYWQQWYPHFERNAIPLVRKPEDQVEVGAPPIKTKYGWLLLHSYIRNYFSANRFFTVEAALLDLKDPRIILARAEMPVLVPEEYYERIGFVPNVVFPSGALFRGDWVHLYYGAADTTCCLVRIQFSSLMNQMQERKQRTVQLSRVKDNPLLAPIAEHAWERKAVFNPAAIDLEGKVHLVYRAMSDDNTSVLGYAASANGIRIDERAPEPIYVPREPFEEKRQPGGNSGCEDPRLTRIGEKIYMCYTAFDGVNPPRVALTWISARDFLERHWNWARPVLISPPGVDDKDALVFPRKVNGKYLIVHRSGDDIDLGFSATLDFTGDEWLEEYRWLGPRRGWWDGRKVGAAAPPLRTKDGWLLLYHGVSERGNYRVGAVLLDRKNPMRIIARTDNPIFEPDAPYEREGQVANVVFPCGAVLRDNTLFVYYGGGDKVVCAATVPLDKLIATLKRCLC